MIPHHRFCSLIALTLLAACLAGCTIERDFIATPNVCLGQPGREMFAAVPPALRTPDMPVLFASDRRMETEGDVHRYGFKRSESMYFGSAVVHFDQPITWDQLIDASTSRERQQSLTLSLESLKAIGRLTVPLDEMEVRDGRWRLPDRLRDELDESQAKFHDLLTERLAGSPKKDVYVFVHGFNNTFEEAVFRIGMLWHFMGRQGVPIAYTWPAGRGGLFGYAYDRESGEFTVYHLRRFLKTLALCPAVERIHLIAHSRGCDVATSALRELKIEYNAKGLDMQKELKLENLILAAPDIDQAVFNERVEMADLHIAARRTTIYFSGEDFALRAARFLFGDSARVGSLSVSDISPEKRKKFSLLHGFALIECRVNGYSSSHAYVFAHPAAISDLILVLRDDRDPGDKNGRPLSGSPTDNALWAIGNDYPKGEPKKEAP